MEAGCRRRTLLASFKGRRSRILVAGPCISLGNGGMPRSVDQFGTRRVSDGAHHNHHGAIRSPGCSSSEVFV